MSDAVAQTQPLFDQAKQASEKSIDLAASGANLQQSLRDAVTGRLQASPLFGQREEAAKNLITAVPQARSELADLVQSGEAILSPNQQQSILTGRRAAATVPLMSLNDLLQAQTGGMETAISGGLGAFQALQQAQAARAQLAQQQAQDAFNNLIAQEQLDISRQKAGGGGMSPIEQAIAALLQQRLSGGLGGGFQQPTEPMPTGTPSQSLISRVLGGGGQINSPEGQWTFVDGEWLPIVD
jgi:hypothetical protein